MQYCNTNKLTNKFGFKKNVVCVYTVSHGTEHTIQFNIER